MRLSASDISRFWSKVDRTEGCWEWTASTVRGYGQIVIGGRRGKVLRAHRIAYELEVGPIPPGMLVCHKCDNPSCVNPDHLFLGSYKDNMDDMYAKGRDKTRKKPRRPRKLSDEQVLAIRSDKRKLSEIASDYGVSAALVSGIRNGHRRQYI